MEISFIKVTLTHTILRQDREQPPNTTTFQDTDGTIPIGTRKKKNTRTMNNLSISMKYIWVPGNAIKTDMYSLMRKLRTS